MPEDDPVARTAMGAACAIFDGEGRVLLVHHTYGRRNWELPGGLVEHGESPDQAARRELLEETGLRAEPERLTGLYFEPEHAFGPMLHLVFRVPWDGRQAPVASSDEISEAAWWPLDDLPRPISDFTERRIHDALREGRVDLAQVPARRWLE